MLQQVCTLMMIIANSHQPMFGIISTTTTSSILVTGSCPHSLFVNFGFFISNIFLMRLLSFLGNISYLILENAGGIIFSWIFACQISPLLLWVFGFSRKTSLWCMIILVKKVRTLFGNMKSGIATKDLDLFFILWPFSLFISWTVSLLTITYLFHQYTHSQFVDFLFGLDLDQLHSERDLRMLELGIHLKENSIQFREELDGLLQLFSSLKHLCAGNIDTIQVTLILKPQLRLHSTFGDLG